MKQAGKFISFEGIDGAGKSTHIPFVQQWLEAQQRTVLLTREPGGTALGETLRSMLLQQSMQVETEALLMFAARCENLAQLIRPALARGEWVISDRFTDSSIAYQGGGRKLALHQLRMLQEFALQGQEPDLTLLFDVPLEVARSRLAGQREADKFEREHAAFFQAVRQQYLQLAAQYPARIRVIDASQSIAQIQENIVEILQNFYQSAIRDA